jgi:hypothetical protein
VRRPGLLSNTTQGVIMREVHEAVTSHAADHAGPWLLHNTTQGMMP